MDMLSSSGVSVARRIAPVLVALALGCDSAVRPNVPEQPVKKEPPQTDSATTTGLPTHIELAGDTSWAYVDREFSLAVKARDEHWNFVDADSAEISTSDPSLARLDQAYPWSERFYPGGPQIKMVLAQFDLAATGTTIFRARLATVVAVYFSVPTVNTRLCTGSLFFEPGSFQYVDTKRENYYASDLEMAARNGTPVPDGLATARLIVSDAQGHLGSIETTGPILRGPTAPIVPTSSSETLNWLCWGGV
jgi:hypothetical protein